MKGRLIWAAAVALGAFAAFVINVPCRFGDTADAVAKVELRAIDAALAVYRNDYGAYPTGSASQIASALLGENARHVTYIDGMTQSQEGFLDPWVQPYGISVNSGMAMIVSEGPDRQIGTKDDLGLRAAEPIR